MLAVGPIEIQMKHLWSAIAWIAALTLAPALGVGQTTSDVQLQPLHNITISLDGDWLVASRGRDDNAQEMKLKVWGSLRDESKFEKGFEQLDDDAEEEYVVISRNEGTGPYYKLQILDFRPDGILTWSYDSFGRPRVENGRVLLGARQKYEGATHSLDYRVYRYTSSGLVPVE